MQQSDIQNNDEEEKLNTIPEVLVNDILKIEEHSKCFYQKCKCNNSNYKQ